MSEETFVDHSSQFSLDRARKENLRVVVPKSHELQVDIDSDEAYAHFTQAYNFLASLGLVSGYESDESRSGLPHRHITVKTPLKVTPIERIALQAILGSDYRREGYSYARLQEGEAIPTLFFEKL